MIDLLDRWLRFMLLHRAWLGLAIGLLAFGESLAVVGAIIPATPALFFLGTLVGSGQIRPMEVLPWFTAGAIGGYWASWDFGRRVGYRAYGSRWLKGHRREIARIRLYFRRRGGPSLLIGRFILGPFQAMLPLVAGAARMSSRRFHLWNLISSLTWTVVVLTPGFLAAKGIVVLGGAYVNQRNIILVLMGVSGALIIGALLLTAQRMLWSERIKKQ